MDIDGSNQNSRMIYLYETFLKYSHPRINSDLLVHFMKVCDLTSDMQTRVATNLVNVTSLATSLPLANCSERPTAVYGVREVTGLIVPYIFALYVVSYRKWYFMNSFQALIVVE